jgi:hypothetical protein
MKVDCLLGTYGRYGLVCEALACFLQQSKISNATLLIYNQHPNPLSFDHPRVRVVNETGRNTSLRHIRQRMHELSDASADLIHWWDDDDLYLPWHLEDCLKNIGENIAWKPASSWLLEGNAQYSRCQNRFEGSWVFRADYLRRAPIDTHPTYSDHPVVRQVEDAGLLATTELGDNTSYIYRWNTGAEHLSTYPGTGSEQQQIVNILKWRERSADVNLGGRLVPADLSGPWRQFLKATKHKVAPEDWELNRSRLRPYLRWDAIGLLRPPLRRLRNRLRRLHPLRGIQRPPR